MDNQVTEKKIQELVSSQPGQEILALDQMGYKLTKTQGELTPTQARFLLLGYSRLHQEAESAQQEQMRALRSENTKPGTMKKLGRSAEEKKQVKQLLKGAR